MKLRYILWIVMMVAYSATADRLHTVDFETENDGYVPSTVWTDIDSESGHDYFMRATDQQTTGMIPFGNIQGSHFWAAEDTDNLASVPYITTAPIDITGYTSFTTTVAFAIDDRDSSRFEAGEDYINFEYSIDGAAFEKFGALLVNAESWQLLKDNDADGVGDEASGITSTFTDVDFAFEGIGSTLEFRIATYVGGSEEVGIDNIRIAGAIPEPTTMALISSAALVILGVRRFLS